MHCHAKENSENQFKEPLELLVEHVHVNEATTSENEVQAEDCVELGNLGEAVKTKGHSECENQHMKRENLAQFEDMVALEMQVEPDQVQSEADETISQVHLEDQDGEIKPESQHEKAEFKKQADLEDKVAAQLDDQIDVQPDNQNDLAEVEHQIELDDKIEPEDKSQDKVEPENKTESETEVDPEDKTVSSAEPEDRDKPKEKSVSEESPEDRDDPEDRVEGEHREDRAEAEDWDEVENWAEAENWADAEDRVDLERKVELEDETQTVQPQDQFENQVEPEEHTEQESDETPLEPSTIGYHPSLPQRRHQNSSEELSFSEQTNQYPIGYSRPTTGVETPTSQTQPELIYTSSNQFMWTSPSQSSPSSIPQGGNSIYMWTTEGLAPHTDSTSQGQEQDVVADEGATENGTFYQSYTLFVPTPYYTYTVYPK